MQTRIVTPRLILRGFEETDAAALFAYAQNPNIGPAAGWKPHADEAESLRIIRTFFMREDNREWAITLREGGRLVGSIGVWPDGRRSTVPGAMEIGYVLDEACWGQGLMPEAVRAVMAHAFGPLGATILSANHYPFNKQSGRVLQKCGMRHEGVLRMAATVYTGEVRDHVCYSITREEFEASLG